MRLIVAAIIVVIVVAAAGAYFFYSTTQPPPPPPAPKILKIVTSNDFTTWDPSASYSTEVFYMANFYEPLLYANPPGSAEPLKPALATSWDVSADSLNWTFHLRSGVTFHDGEPFNAQAVKYSFNRTVTMGLGAGYLLDVIHSIDVLDNLTVRINLNWAAPLTRVVSAENGMWIMSPKSAEKGKDWFEAGNEAGTGPWKLESYKPGAEVVMTRFDAYWGGWQPGQFDKVDITISTEEATQREMLESGEVDIAQTVPLESIPVLNQTSGLIVYATPSFYNYLAFLNTKKPPLDNVLVRQAISYAMPYNDIITVAAKGYATQSKGPVPKGLWPYQENLSQYTHDLDKAKALLTQAGYPNGFNRTLVLTYAAENPSEDIFAPLIKSELQKLGISVEIRSIPWVEQWALAKKNPATAQDILLLLWWPSLADGYDNLYSMFHSETSPYFNLGYWYNSTYDNLIDTAYATEATDPATANEMYFKAQSLLVEAAPAVFLYDAMDLVPMRTSIKGFVDNAYYPFVIFFYQLTQQEATSALIQPTIASIVMIAPTVMSKHERRVRPS
jgi:peptide/nickel transport system substrate-binding protein